MDETQTHNYPYLENGGSTVTLAADVATVSEFTGGVTGDERRKAESLLAGVTGISLHDHPTRLPDPLTSESWQEYRAAGRAYHGFEGLRRSGMSAVFVNAWSFAPPEQVIQFLSWLRADVAHHEGFFIAETAADLARTTGSGGADGVGLYLALESATAFADQPETFEQLYGLGLRMAGLCYNDGNAFGEGLASGEADAGLTAAGKDAVRMFNELGIIIDLGHAGDRTALDTVAASSSPVVVSHAGARTLWDTSRMKHDDLLKALAASGGMIGISAAPNTTRSKDHPAHTIDSFMDHLFYCVDLMGIDHVGLGPDTMFGHHAGIHKLGRGGNDSQWGKHSGREQGGLVDFVDGVENPAENFLNVAVYLLRKGWANNDIQKILGGNARRMLDVALVR